MWLLSMLMVCSLETNSLIWCWCDWRRFVAASTLTKHYYFSFFLRPCGCIYYVSNRPESIWRPPPAHHSHRYRCYWFPFAKPKCAEHRHTFASLGPDFRGRIGARRSTDTYFPVNYSTPAALNRKEWHATVALVHDESSFHCTMNHHRSHSHRLATILRSTAKCTE